MPTYEYLCPSCGNEFEEFQSMTEAPIETCPRCSRRVQRLMGAGAGIVFKGSGFYQTDYKNTRKPSKREEETKKPAPADISKTSSDAGSKQSPGASSQESPKRQSD